VGTGIFESLPNPMTATRYHSLVIRPPTLSKDFEMTAWAIDPDGYQEIMAIQHRKFPTFGVQFHPESFLTVHGIRLLQNFLATTV
jgi:anthranilate/para-aminobenzoate synthase component II